MNNFFGPCHVLGRHGLIFLLLSLLLCGCSTWTKYPGALRQNQCLKYALHCTADLRYRNIEAYHVGYEWIAPDSEGSHASVLFWQGVSWYVVDNEQPYPRRVYGRSAIEMIRCHDKWATYIITELPDGFPYHHP